MAKVCSTCKKTGGIFKDSNFIIFMEEELCIDCANDLIEKINKEIIITGTGSISGYNIIDYIDVISTETIIGVGLFVEMVGKATDYFENKTSLIEKNIKKVRETLKKRLKTIAYEKEGNAIVKFRFNYEGIAANRMVMSASGTVVKLSKEE